MIVGAAKRYSTSAVVFLAVCSVICLVAFFACLELSFVAGSCWQLVGAKMVSSVMRVFMSLEIEKRFLVRRLVNWSN